MSDSSVNAVAKRKRPKNLLVKDLGFWNAQTSFLMLKKVKKFTDNVCTPCTIRVTFYTKSLYMKKLILPLFAFISYASNAQFSILPQLGMETLRTTIQSGNFSSFSPAGLQFAPRLSVRAAYNLKSGQGAFVGIATGSPAVQFKFADPNSAREAFTTATKDIQLRLEAGYQFTSKPITLKKSANTNVVNTGNYVHRYGQSEGSAGRSCAARRMSCGMRSAASRASNAVVTAVPKDNGVYLRIKPLIGIALAPSQRGVSTEKSAGRTTYNYIAGSNTALIAGTAFEIGKRNEPGLVLSVNYLGGLGNNTQTITSSDVLKPTVTTFSSMTSGFNISVGVPLSFKKKTVITQAPQISQPPHRGQCGRYRMYQM